ncbi:TerC family protein [Candidatus Acetothermia bacterium]|nr:TerC family protein [Candidatus Acetothermia bacterium]
MDWNAILPWLIALGYIIWVNIILSGDNAVVIGMAAHHLPGKLRKRAIFFGTLGAIALRIILTITANYLLKLDLLQAIGGILLIWIAVKLIWEDDTADEKVQAAQTFWHAMRIIIIADVIMSLDNVLAIAAIAQDDLMLTLGLIISMLLIMFGAALIVGLLNRWPWLNSVGAAIIAYVAVDLIFSDPFFHKNHWPILTDERLHWVTPWVCATALLVYGLWLSRKHNQMHQSSSATSMNPSDK